MTEIIPFQSLWTQTKGSTVNTVIQRLLPLACPVIIEPVKKPTGDRARLYILMEKQNFTHSKLLTLNNNTVYPPLGRNEPPNTTLKHGQSITTFWLATRVNMMIFIGWHVFVVPAFVNALIRQHTNDWLLRTAIKPLRSAHSNFITSNISWMNRDGTTWSETENIWRTKTEKIKIKLLNLKNN